MFTKFDEALPRPVLLNLGIYKSFDEKFIATYEHAIIRELYVEVSNMQDIAPIPSHILQVIQMVVQPGAVSATHSILNDCSDILKSEVDTYIKGTDDFDSITKTLESCITKCDQGLEKNDVNELFSFDQNIVFQVYRKGNWIPIKYQYINWSNPLIHQEFLMHFNIRNGFFKRMGRILRNALAFHKSESDPLKMPYAWDSPKAELEISELLYVLYLTSGQLTIDFDAGGSFPKFKRAFFGLFGLSDKNYDKKVSEIRKRKGDDHFINRLANKFNEEHTKLFRKKQK